MKLGNCSAPKRQTAMERCCKSIMKKDTDYKVFIVYETMCLYLNGRKCLNSFLLVLRDHASFGNKELVFVFFVWKQPAITRHIAHRETGGSCDYKTSHFEKIITHQEDTIAS